MLKIAVWLIAGLLVVKYEHPIHKKVNEGLECIAAKISVHNYIHGYDRPKL